MPPSKCFEDGAKVCGGGGEKCVGGAEPLVDHRLLAGHHDSIRPSGAKANHSEMMKEEILTDIAGGVNEMLKKEDYHQRPTTDG